jgi:hypothetical protein
VQENSMNFLHIKSKDFIVSQKVLLFEDAASLFLWNLVENYFADAIFPTLAYGKRF